MTEVLKKKQGQTPLAEMGFIIPDSGMILQHGIRDDMIKRI